MRINPQLFNTYSQEHYAACPADVDACRCEEIRITLQAPAPDPGQPVLVKGMGFWQRRAYKAWLKEQRQLHYKHWLKTQTRRSLREMRQRKEED